MNRYAATGLMLDALGGRTVLVLTSRADTVRTAMDEVQRILPDDPDAFEVRRAGRTGQIRFPSGGRLVFASAQSNHRGMSADAVFLDVDADRHLDAIGWKDLRLVAHPHGEIVRA